VVVGVTAPDIAVEQPAGTLLASGGRRSFPAVALSKKASLTFIVRNTAGVSNSGSAAYLRITRISLSGANASEFHVSRSSISYIKPGRLTTFYVQFVPQSEGHKEALLSLTSNDPDESPYLIQLSASTPNSGDSGDDSEHSTEHATAATPSVQTSGVSAAVPDVPGASIPPQVTRTVVKTRPHKAVTLPAEGSPPDPLADATLYKLMLYALSGDPAAAAEADAMPEQEVVADHGHNYAALTFRRLKSADLWVYQVEESTDSTHWQSLPIPWPLVGDALDNGDGSEWVTVRSNVPLTPASQRFMRLRVEILP